MLWRKTEYSERWHIIVGRYLIVGGSGLVGQALVKRLIARGDQVAIGTRSPYRANLKDERMIRLPLDAGAWDKAVEDKPFDGVVNLAGHSISSGRWTSEVKNAILQSRISTTNLIVDWIEKAPVRPRVLVNASAVGFYGPSETEVFTEDSQPHEQDFLGTVAGAWENAAGRATAIGVRVVTARLGIVLASDGGALPRLIIPYRMRVGGTIGSGRQWVSWVHVSDAARLFEFALDQTELNGPVNVTSPMPVTMRDLGKAVAAELGTHSSFPVPGLIIKAVLGEAGSLILTGQKVIPSKAVSAGFSFQFPSIQGALHDLLSNR